MTNQAKCNCGECEQREWGNYLVTRCGAIISKKLGTPLYQFKSQSRRGWYYKAVVYIEGVRKCIYVHRVVAEVFLGQIAGLEVDHGPMGTLVNDVDNLTVVTAEENKRLYRERQK